MKETFEAALKASRPGADPIYVGIDPGASGAVGIITGANCFAADLPTVKVKRKGGTKTTFFLPEIASAFSCLAIYREVVRVAVEESQVQIRGKGANAYTAFRVGCLAAGTPVLTENRGWVSIECVQDSDRLWDGCSWVNHGGIIYQGRKTCLNLLGVRLTADHRVLSSSGWITAETAAALLKTGEVGADAFRAGSESLVASEGVLVAGASPKTCLIDCSPSFGLSFPAATTASAEATRGTADVVSESTLLGEATRENSSDIWPRSPGLATDYLRSTGLPTTKGITRGTFDSRPPKCSRETKEVREWWSITSRECRSPNSSGNTAPTSTTKPREGDFSAADGGWGRSQRLPSSRGHFQTEGRTVLDVYDILNAGPRSRFQVAGFIASNCSYGMWPLFLTLLRLPFETVHPFAWKKKSGLTGLDKEAIRLKAAGMFPGADLCRKKDHNRAEALLLADWLESKHTVRK
jgi:hypothetical protein